MGPMSESQSNPRLSVPLSLLFLSLGAVKIMDCHAKWPDTRGQRGCLGGGAGEEGGNCRRGGGVEARGAFG